VKLKLFSILGYLLLAAALAALILRKSIFAEGYFLAAVQFLSVMLMLWARITFGLRSFHFAANPTEGELVSTGPYKFIRHPIYASAIYFASAAVISHLSLFNILLIIVCCIGAAIRIYSEEKFLLAKYPEYYDYAKRTKRIFPFIV
jgi:protein-S-isoprenylcysteine O-methyltransferase Ste14